MTILLNKIARNDLPWPSRVNGVIARTFYFQVTTAHCGTSCPVIFVTAKSPKGYPVRTKRRRLFVQEDKMYEERIIDPLKFG